MCIKVTFDERFNSGGLMFFLFHDTLVKYDYEQNLGNYWDYISMSGYDWTGGSFLTVIFIPDVVIQIILIPNVVLATYQSVSR